MTVANATRRQRRSIVVLAGEGVVSEAAPRALKESLAAIGIDAVYIGQEANPTRIARLAVREAADAVELCLVGRRGVLILRELLRELERLGRRDVSLVVHRVE
jgi:methylmalonyl-CoA mutase cobalamin-binding subunit